MKIFLKVTHISYLITLSIHPRVDVYTLQKKNVGGELKIVKKVLRIRRGNIISTITRTFAPKYHSG